MEGDFFHRAGHAATGMSREVSELADRLRARGLPNQAAVAQSAADALSRLAYDAGADLSDFASVAEVSSTCAAAMDNVAEGSAEAAGEEAVAARALAKRLHTLARDALSETQPIDPSEL